MIKILYHSNFSEANTGFGKAAKNFLLALYNDPNYEIIEAANHLPEYSDGKKPWKCRGTLSQDINIINQIRGDHNKERANSYGYYVIDKIIEEERPDIYIGVEDVWAFYEYSNKPWWNIIHKIIWTTLDSIPILPFALDIAPKCDKFLVWASFAKKELNKNGIHNVEVLHGPVDISNFYPFDSDKKLEIRKRHGIGDDFIIGFVFKNQLRKSVTNLIDGFVKFKELKPELKPKLLLHTDWADIAQGWDIPRYMREKSVENDDVLAGYVCNRCGNYFVRSYVGEEKDCNICHCQKSVNTKTSDLGVSEEQLNEIYNLMDVYCHPFTSGGQEIPIQEAKAAGLITLVTEYSCGTDSCYPDQGGIPLDWKEYREPQTQFVKATTLPESICEKLVEVATMPSKRREQFCINAKNYVEEEFSVSAVIDKFKELIKDFDKVEYPESEAPVVSSGKFSDFFDKSDENKRIAVVMPESAGDLLFINSLLDNLKSLYPDDNLYVITKNQFFDMVEDHPAVYKLIPYSDGLDNLLYLEGQNNHNGYFRCAFLPFVGSQRVLNYMHNGSDKCQFELY